jgi:hypothetical protein
MGVWERHPGEILGDVKADHAKFVRRLGWRHFHGLPPDEADTRRKWPDGADSAIDLLRELVSDRTIRKDTRRSAENALIALGDAGAVVRLRATAVDDEQDREDRLAAVKLLGLCEGSQRAEEASSTLFMDVRVTQWRSKLGAQHPKPASA